MANPRTIAPINSLMREVTASEYEVEIAITWGEVGVLLPRVPKIISTVWETYTPAKLWNTLQSHDVCLAARRSIADGMEIPRDVVEIATHGHGSQGRYSKVTLGPFLQVDDRTCLWEDMWIEMLEAMTFRSILEYPNPLRPLVTVRVSSEDITEWMRLEAQVFYAAISPKREVSKREKDGVKVEQDVITAGQDASRTRRTEIKRED